MPGMDWDSTSENPHGWRADTGEWASLPTYGLSGILGTNRGEPTPLLGDEGKPGFIAGRRSIWVVFPAVGPMRGCPIH